jgi:hypothetical protein
MFFGGVQCLDVQIVALGAPEVSVMRDGLAALLELAFSYLFEDALDATGPVVGDAFGNALGDSKSAFELVLVLLGARSVLEAEAALGVVELRNGVGGEGKRRNDGDNDDEDRDEGKEAGHFFDFSSERFVFLGYWIFQKMFFHCAQNVINEKMSRRFFFLESETFCKKIKT